jgi:ankyrin repeat protein
VNHVNTYGQTALSVAATHGHVEAIIALLAAGAEVDHAETDGNTAMYGAASRGHAEAVRVLVAAGAEVSNAGAFLW